MFKYISKFCILGMMSERYEVLGNWQGFKKNRNKAVSFYTDFIPDFKEVFFQYIYEKPECKSSRMTQVVSKLDDEFFNLSGKQFKEIRETRNKFDKIVKMKEYNKDDTLKLIDTWDIQCGGKYHWHRHSGYDRAFFNKWYDLERDSLFSRFFYIDDKMIGYSVLHKDKECYEYLIRKTDITLRNTCLYVDYKTFEEIHKIDGNFLVNWGASSGSLLKYKRKFPKYEENDVYFYSIKSCP